MVETYHLDLRTALKRKLGGLEETSSITEDRCCSWGHAGERTHHAHITHASHTSHALFYLFVFSFALDLRALKRNIEGAIQLTTFLRLTNYVSAVS